MSAELEAGIARTFASRHPAEAARLLEPLPAAEVGDVLIRLELPTAASVLESMVTAQSSAALAQVPDERASELLAAVSARTAASLARSLDEASRRRVVDRLPKATRVLVERVLRYPEGTAGALMEPNVLAFHRSLTVGDAVSVLAGAAPGLRFYVYVVDDDEKLVGCLSFRELGYAANDAALEAVMRSPVESVAARAGRRAVVSHPAWTRLPVLPVVDERDRLVGVLRYETFRQLEGADDDADAPGPLGMALALSELFWVGASGLFRGVGGDTADVD